jgi:hypothetical protein
MPTIHTKCMARFKNLSLLEKVAKKFGRYCSDTFLVNLFHALTIKYRVHCTKGTLYEAH